MSNPTRFLRTALTSALVCACLAVSASALTYGVGTVTGDSLRLRQGAGSNTSILTTVPKGTEVLVLEDQQGGWYKVDLNGTVGYMSADYLSVTVQTSANLGTGTLNTDGASLNMRSGPGTGYGKIASIPANATLTITGIENGWYKTSYNGVDGFVSSDFVVLAEEASAPSSTPAQTVRYGTLNTNGASLNMRSGPGTGYKKLASIPASATLTITASENGWCKTSYNGVEGYVSCDYVVLSNDTVTSSPAPAQTAQYGILNTGGASLNMRSGPGTGYKKLASIPASAALTITGSENGWYKTSYIGITGYVSSDYVILTDTAPSSTVSVSNSDLGAQVVAYAKQFLGIPYVYGANGPSAYDCSSFTSTVYKHFGYSLNRSAAGQYSNGTVIDQSQLQPGDLLVWRAYGSSKLATHVGIYIGNGQYIHASSSGGCIKINDMDYGSNSRYLVGVRRILT